MAVCVKSLALHPSDTVWLSAIELFIVTNLKPFNDQVRPLYTHSSIHPAALPWATCGSAEALSSVTSVSWAGDFKRSTCLSISSAPLSQPSLGYREREGEDTMQRGRAIWRPQSSGPQVCPWHCLWDRPGGRLLSFLQALHLAPTASLHSPWAKLHFAQPYWFFGGAGKVWLNGESEWGRGEMEKKRGSFLKHWLLLDCSSRRDNPVRTTQWPWCPSENC